jgi:glycosyltransferase involved in cell wall biosynthesis
MISSLVLTYNEECNIRECLSCLDFTDEILVFDSFSTDNTVTIAREMGARVIQRKFDNYASQRNAALKAISAGSDWILMVDADEFVSPELKSEILNIIREPANPVSLYLVRRKDMFQGKWIKYSSGYPTWFGRLFRNGKVWVEREINEEYHTSGETGYLKEHLIHHPFRKGLSHWFEKHNRYSSMEAEIVRDEMNEKPRLSDLFSKDPLVRRKVQKRISLYLPFRPLIVFIAFYFIRGGFLDGKRGYTFCKLRKTYEWMIELKRKEISAGNNGL